MVSINNDKKFIDETAKSEEKQNQSTITSPLSCSSSSTASSSSVIKSNVTSPVIKSSVKSTPLPQKSSTSFTSVLKNANDSSLDNILEFKSILSPSVAVGAKGNNKIELCDHDCERVNLFLKKLHDEKLCGGDDDIKTVRSDNSVLLLDSECEERYDFDFKNENNSSSDSADCTVNKKLKFNNNNNNFKADVIKVSRKNEKYNLDDSLIIEKTGNFLSILPSSTPIKPRAVSLPENHLLQVAIPSETGNVESYKLNLLTPPADASFIDSDFESMDQDQYDSVVSEDVVKENFRDLSSDSDDKEETMIQVQVEPVASATPPSKAESDKSRRGSFLEETLRRTPLAIRRTFQRQTNIIPKTAKNFFSIKKKTKPKDNLNDKSSESIDEETTLHSAVPDFIVKSSDFSFECEPSTSDAEAEDDDDENNNTRTTNDSSFEFEAPLVPTFKIDPPVTPSPPPICDYASALIRSSYATRIPTAAYLRRSVSDPDAFKILMENNSMRCNYDDEGADFQALDVVQKNIHHASIKSLEVSIHKS